MSADIDPRCWLEEHGNTLYRFALLRVQDPALAEDLVQETLLAGLKARAGYAGNASVCTWLVSILKNKVTDHWRASGREAPLADEAGEGSALEELFQSNGHWSTTPQRWADPDGCLEQKEFWRVFSECLQRLPPRQAEAFLLCELDELSGADAGRVMEVSTTNLWVLLHRARLRLRDCLELRWFGAGVEARSA